MKLTENLNEKWAPVLDHPDLPKITDSHKRAVTAMCLENTEYLVYCRKQHQLQSTL